MLTATSMEVTTLSLPGTELNLQTANQFIYVATPIEGGYIPLNVPPTGLVLNSDAWLTPSALQNLITNGTLSTDGDTWTYFDPGDSTSNGIRPVVIVLDGGGGFQLIPIPAEGENPGSSETSEGGPIAIATILEELPGAAEEIGEGSPTASVGELLGAERAQPRSTDSPMGHAMSGELERAIMFEMAGGDPVGVGQPATHNGTYNENWLGDAPLSLRSTQQRGADQTPSEMTEAGVHESAASEPRDLTSAALEYHAYFRERGNWHESQANRAAVISETFAIHSNSKISTNAMLSYDDSDSAHEEAFVQFAEQEKSVMYYMADGAARRGLSAIPLLTLLALERVAARNSRRANKLAAAVDPRRPATEDGNTGADA